MKDSMKIHLSCQCIYSIIPIITKYIKGVISINQLNDNKPVYNSPLYSR